MFPDLAGRHTRMAGCLLEKKVHEVEIRAIHDGSIPQNSSHAELPNTLNVRSLTTVDFFYPVTTQEAQC